MFLFVLKPKIQIKIKIALTAGLTRIRMMEVKLKQWSTENVNIW